jgi:hypothetical protein
MTRRSSAGILNSPNEMSKRMTNLQGAPTTMKSTMKLAVLAAGMMWTSIAAQATTINFNVMSGGTNSAASAYGNVRTFSSSGLNVTATAWSLPTSSADFAAAQLGRATNYGLWACNTGEGINCSSPEHQIDNVGGMEFVLFQFSQAVDPSSISITTYSQADLDVSYYLGNVASNLSLASVNLAELAGLGFGGRINDDVNSYATSRTVSIVNNGGVNALLVGARISGDSKADYFKIQQLSVNTVSDVPEPGTFLMTGAALFALGLVRRAKKV